MRSLGHRVVFATPDGKPAAADARILTGRGLGVLARVLMADANGRQAYVEMAASPEFQHPIPWAEARVADFQGWLLPGGHAPGLKPYLESAVLQSLVAAAFAAGLPVGAICPGVVLAAPGDFVRGPMSSKRDAPDQLGRGFTVRDGLYLPARWPGDAHRIEPRRTGRVYRTTGLNHRAPAQPSDARVGICTMLRLSAYAGTVRQ